MTFCSSCGSRLNGRFCASCGAEAVSATPRRSEETWAVVAQQNVTRPPVLPIPETLVNASVTIRSGESCPICFSTLYHKQYTFWHIVVCVLAFPFGLLVLFAPVKRCEQGHGYGLGSWIVGWLQVAAIACTVLIGLAAFAYVSYGNSLNHRVARTVGAYATSASPQESSKSTSIMQNNTVAQSAATPETSQASPVIQLSAAQAASIVHSEGALTVSQSQTCAGGNLEIAVQGYANGCTNFDGCPIK